MKKLELVEYYLAQINDSLNELKTSNNYRDKLRYWKELLLISRQIYNLLELYENDLRLEYKRSTGLRAVLPLWKKLSTESLDKQDSVE